MPFTAAVQVLQGDTCSEFTIKDISSYATETTANFSNRVITLYDYNDVVLSTIPFTFAAYPSGEYIHTGLSVDDAYSVRLTLTPITSGAGSVYVKTILFSLICFTKASFYTRVQEMRVNPTLERNKDFITRTMRVFMESESATKASSEGDNLSAHNALVRAKLIADDPNR